VLAVRYPQPQNKLPDESDDAFTYPPQSRSAIYKITLNQLLKADGTMRQLTALRGGDSCATCPNKRFK
jgi:hypothetical protein